MKKKIEKNSGHKLSAKIVSCAGTKFGINDCFVGTIHADMKNKLFGSYYLFLLITIPYNFLQAVFFCLQYISCYFHARLKA